MASDMLLSLDLGTQTGWALGDLTPIEPVFSSGTQSFALGRYDGSGMRYLRFQRWLDEMFEGGLHLVTFEEVRRHAGTDAAHVYGGLQGMLLAQCERHGVPCEGVPVGTIKKFWTGNGSANKSLMMAKAREKGYFATDDNEADAIALWMLTRSKHRK